MNVIYVLLAGLTGYLTGAIPFGFVFVKWVKGIDLREVGSGRTGGTNSMRAAGFGVGFITFMSDVAKGAAAVWITQALWGGVLPADWLPWAEVTAGTASVIGHNWSVFLKFKGGAGTGPNLGWATAVWWPLFPINIVVGGLVLRFQGMASVGSLTVAALIVIFFLGRYFTVGTPIAYPVGGVIAAIIVTWSLRPNIKRILAGTERVVGPRAGKTSK